MSTETATTTADEQALGGWKYGIAGGLVAGIVFGLMLTMQMRGVIAMAIPAMYGLSGIAAGWAAHLFHSAALGAVFGVVADTAFDGASLGKYLGLGLAYGVVLWIVLAVLVMPVWLGVVGFPNAPSVPNVNVMSLIGHLVYGLVLGGTYALLVGE